MTLRMWWNEYVVTEDTPISKHESSLVSLMNRSTEPSTTTSKMAGVLRVRCAPSAIPRARNTSAAVSMNSHQEGASIAGRTQRQPLLLQRQRAHIVAELESRGCTTTEVAKTFLNLLKISSFIRKSYELYRVKLFIVRKVLDG